MSVPVDAPLEIVEIAQPDAATAQRLEPQLCALLLDAVAGGASLGFWAPLDDADARDYWRAVFAEVVAGERRLLVAQRAGAALGSVQLGFTRKQNAARRAEVQKLMVHRAARRQGIGGALMEAVARLARESGRTLLFLDTQTGSDAERLYATLGYQRVGVIPDYTLEVDGQTRATTLFYKSLIGDVAEAS